VLEAEQTRLVAEKMTLQKTLSENLETVSKKHSQISQLQAKVGEMKQTIISIDRENKVLQAKLAAAQQHHPKAPGSVAKANAMGRGVLPVNGDEGAWMAKKREELYADLTNLIIMVTKKEQDTVCFECLQTGPNGGEFFLSPLDISPIGWFG
jgi:chromosome segregation ATPase